MCSANGGASLAGISTNIQMSEKLRSPLTYLGVIIIWLWAPFFILGPYSFFTMGDSGDFVVPVNIALGRFMALGDYWFPFLLSGIDRLGHGSSTPFDHFGIV